MADPLGTPIDAGVSDAMSTKPAPESNRPCMTLSASAGSGAMPPSAKVVVATSPPKIPW